jgi:hypothetical protein
MDSEFLFLTEKRAEAVAAKIVVIKVMTGTKMIKAVRIVPIYDPGGLRKGLASL